MEPTDVLEATEDKSDQAKSRLNATVAVTVAILATFMGICKVKDDNICQAMQQAQADKIDNWGWYQAKKTRDEMMKEHISDLTIQAAAASPANRPGIESEIARVKADLAKKKDELKDTQAKAEANQKDYDRLNYRDDQFDLSDSALALAISLLAVTSLTQKRFLFLVALIPIGVGILMGLAGLFGWHIHSDALASWLGA
jgi:hypothetical protein